MSEEKFQKIAAKIEADTYAMICGGVVPKSRPTALRVRGGGFDVVEIGDDGKIIEPCPYCGPVLLCSKHMAMIT